MVLRAVAVGLASLLAVGCARSAPIHAPTVVFIDAVGGEGAPSAPGDALDRDGAWTSKDEVEVEWRGSWWPAVVLEKRGGGRWLVRYDGYGSDWDEVVGPERIRERRAEAQADEPEEPDDEPDP
ncbi:MAG: hypothetical protein KF764_14900 [Labilithrix sp.]|nr:hypothetical protein [Labilithrix sp.]MBX3222522.1 hypothetical protein [Labilithrix sp.]